MTSDYSLQEIVRILSKMEKQINDISQDIAAIPSRFISQSEMSIMRVAYEREINTIYKKIKDNHTHLHTEVEELRVNGRHNKTSVIQIIAMCGAIAMSAIALILK